MVFLQLKIDRRLFQHSNKEDSLPLTFQGILTMAPTPIPATREDNSFPSGLSWLFLPRGSFPSNPSCQKEGLLPFCPSASWHWDPPSVDRHTRLKTLPFLVPGKWSLKITHAFSWEVWHFQCTLCDSRQVDWNVRFLKGRLCVALTRQWKNGFPVFASGMGFWTLKKS